MLIEQSAKQTNRVRNGTEKKLIKTTINATH